MADGEVDFDMFAAVDYLPLLDAGKSLTVLSGVHVGCFELRANDSIQAITDLRGKRVGVTAPLGFSADHLLVSAWPPMLGSNPLPTSPGLQIRRSARPTSSPWAKSMPSLAFHPILVNLA